MSGQIQNRSKHNGSSVSKLKKISIDFAVMEKAESVVMLESDFDWDDVGNGQPRPSLLRGPMR